MDWKGDAFESGFFGTRTKYIHSVGATGKVSFTPSPDCPFTGIFKGANDGIIRLSTAAKPSGSQPLAPGFGLKFLRDGKESANMVAMFGVAG